jgi:hypothetical protein
VGGVLGRRGEEGFYRRAEQSANGDTMPARDCLVATQGGMANLPVGKSLRDVDRRRDLPCPQLRQRRGDLTDAGSAMEIIAEIHFGTTVNRQGRARGPPIDFLERLILSGKCPQLARNEALGLGRVVY